MATSSATEQICGRCNGKGQFREYGHVYGGVCFKCGGSGRVKVTAAAARQQEMRDAKRAADQAARAERIAENNAMIATYLPKLIGLYANDSRYLAYHGDALHTFMAEIVVQDAQRQGMEIPSERNRNMQVLYELAADIVAESQVDALCAANPYA